MGKKKHISKTILKFIGLKIVEIIILIVGLKIVQKIGLQIMLLTGFKEEWVCSYDKIGSSIFCTDFFNYFVDSWVLPFTLVFVVVLMVLLIFGGLYSLIKWNWRLANSNNTQKRIKR